VNVSLCPFAVTIKTFRRVALPPADELTQSADKRVSLGAWLASDQVRHGWKLGAGGIEVHDNRSDDTRTPLADASKRAPLNQRAHTRLLVSHSELVVIFRHELDIAGKFHWIRR
jgi:hypothetical protein